MIRGRRRATTLPDINFGGESVGDATPVLREIGPAVCRIERARRLVGRNSFIRVKKTRSL